jgi:hypothetical protein
MARSPTARRRPRPLLAVTLALGLAAAAAPATAHGRGKKAAAARAGKSSAPRAPKVVPNPEGKIVVFPFKDDDDNWIAVLIERVLRSHGLEVVTGVRPVDNAEQFRELAGTLGLAAFVDGSLKEAGSNARVTVQIRNGYTGRRATLVTFKETKLHMRTEIEDKLWKKVGPAMARACVDATKPRKRGRGPLIIEAGTPLASTRDGSDP